MYSIYAYFFAISWLFMITSFITILWLSSIYWFIYVFDRSFKSWPSKSGETCEISTMEIASLIHTYTSQLEAMVHQKRLPRVDGGLEVVWIWLFFCLCAFKCYMLLIQKRRINSQLKIPKDAADLHQNLSNVSYFGN